jgi:hypothetical protein
MIKNYCYARCKACYSVEIFFGEFRHANFYRDSVSVDSSRFQSFNTSSKDVIGFVQRIGAFARHFVAVCTAVQAMLAWAGIVTNGSRFTAT